MANEKLWTLVQHTGWSVSCKPDFLHAVEVRSVPKKIAEAVVKAGGLVFPDYAKAQTAEQYENYPPEVDGIVPHVRGTFVKVKGFEEQIYIPAGRGK